MTSSFLSFLFFFVFFRTADGSCEIEFKDHNMITQPSHELTDSIASNQSPVTTTEEVSDHATPSVSKDSAVHAMTKEKEMSVSGLPVERTSEAVPSTATPSSSSSSSSGGSPVQSSLDTKQESILKKPVVKLMTVEERGEGAVGWNVYQSYFNAANKPFLVVCLLMSFILGDVM